MAFLEHLLLSNLSALIGGSIIGLAVTAFMLLNGRIAGISGIVGGLTDPRRHDLGWRFAFTLGLISGGWIALEIDPSILGLPPPNRSLWILAISGLLIGIGTGFAHGCTSGHGICGLARLSHRSLIATLIFMASGILTATFYSQIFGG